MSLALPGWCDQPRGELSWRYAGVMAEEPQRLTLEELDAMSPAERAAAIDAHYARPGVIITDLDQLPTNIRAQVTATAERIANQRARTE